MSSESLKSKKKSLFNGDGFPYINIRDSIASYCSQENLSEPESASMATGYPKAILALKDTSQEFPTRILNLTNPVKIGRAFGTNCTPDKSNAFFNCKVLSRNHAQLLYQDNKFYLQDTRSSNGTFVNSLRLCPANQESMPKEVFSGNIVQFGVDVVDSQKKINIGCIVAVLKLYHPNGEIAVSDERSSDDLDSQISKSEVWELARYLTQATQRETALQKKLEKINHILRKVQSSSEHNWKAMIEEDRLLRRIEFLQSKLQSVMDTVMKHPDNDLTSLRQKLIKIQEDREVFETKAKENFQRMLSENLSIIAKKKELEIFLKTSEEQREFYSNYCYDLAKEVRQLSEEREKQDKELLEIKRKCIVLEAQLENLRTLDKNIDKENYNSSVGTTNFAEDFKSDSQTSFEPAEAKEEQEISDQSKCHDKLEISHSNDDSNLKESEVQKTKDEENINISMVHDSGTLLSAKTSFDNYFSGAFDFDDQSTVKQMAASEISEPSKEPISQEETPTSSTNSLDHIMTKPNDLHISDSTELEALCPSNTLTTNEFSSPACIPEIDLIPESLEMTEEKPMVEIKPIIEDLFSKDEVQLPPVISVKLLNKEPTVECDLSSNGDESSRKETESEKCPEEAILISNENIHEGTAAMKGNLADIDAQVERLESIGLFFQFPDLLNQLRAQYDELKQKHQRCEEFKEDAIRQYDCLQREYDKILLQNKGYGETFKLFTEKESKFIQDISRLNTKYESALLEITELRASIEDYPSDNLFTSQKLLNESSKNLIESSETHHDNFIEEKCVTTNDLSNLSDFPMRNEEKTKNMLLSDVVVEENAESHGDYMSSITCDKKTETQVDASILTDHSLTPSSTPAENVCEKPLSIINHLENREEILKDGKDKEHEDELWQLKRQKEDFEKSNDVLRNELRSLREEFELVAYQNKTASVCAIVPLLILSLAIIFAYYPNLSSVTGTMES